MSHIQIDAKYWQVICMWLKGENREIELKYINNQIEHIHDYNKMMDIHLQLWVVETTVQ